MRIFNLLILLSFLHLSCNENNKEIVQQKFESIDTLIIALSKEKDINLLYDRYLVPRSDVEPGSYNLFYNQLDSINLIFGIDKNQNVIKTAKLDETISRKSGMNSSITKDEYYIQLNRIIKLMRKYNIKSFWGVHDDSSNVKLTLSLDLDLVTLTSTVTIIELRTERQIDLEELRKHYNSVNMVSEVWAYTID